MARRWARRELRRAEVVGLTAAEPLYPDKVLCAKEGFACDALTDAASARRVLEDRRQHGAPLLYVSFHDARHPDLPGVPESVRNELEPAATRLRIFALVEDWSEATRAMELGARVIYGFPPQAADYVGLAKNPVERADNLHHISLVLRRGRVVARPELLPDLTRGSYVP